VLLELRQHTSSGQFHVLKNYLYEKILDSLVDSTASHSDEAKIRDTLQRGEILFRRGLLEQSWRRTRRALDMARDGEFFLLQLEALESLRGLAIPVLGHSGIDEVRSLGVERKRIRHTSYKRVTHNKACMSVTETTGCARLVTSANTRKRPPRITPECCCIQHKLWIGT